MASSSSLKRLILHPVFIWIEFVLLCGALPTYIIVERMAANMFLFLWGATAYGVLIFWLIARQDDKDVWKTSAVSRANMRPILIRFFYSSIFMLILISVYDPAKRFGLVEARPELWAMMMCLYPFLSALPQEFVFCTYFFKRYQKLFPSTKRLIIASTLVFAYAHVLFINPIAPVLSLIAGYFFATTYAKHRSLALVAIEHALYGNMLFTLGLGWYFWGGSLTHADFG